MKTFLPLLAFVLLTGCVQHYAITTKSGTRISSVGKPKLQGNSYVYKDAQGQQVSIPAVRVKEIGPESESAKSSRFTPGSSK